MFDPLAPLTLANFEKAWGYAPFPRHFLNTVILVTMVLAAQLVLCTLAGFAFARFDFAGRDIAFALVLVQLMIMPEVLIVENYRTMARLGLVDTILGIGLPYMASAFGIFLLRQTFKTIPRELEEAARVEGCSWLGVLWRVYVPAGAPHLPRLRAGLGELPLEQLPLAADRHQLGEHPAAHRRPRDLRRAGVRRRLVGDQRRHADGGRAAARGVSAVSAAVHAVVHAGRHQIAP